MLDKFKNDPMTFLASHSIREEVDDKERPQIKRYIEQSGAEIFRVFNENELTSISYKNLAQYIPEDKKENWCSEYRKVRERIGLMFDELKLLGKNFKVNSLKVVALKNGGLAQVEGGDLGQHPMGDIDLFISKCQFVEAHKIILDNGFSFKFRSEFEEEDFEKAFEDGSTEYYKELPTGQLMWLELSWRSVSGRWINRKREPKASELLERAIEWNIPGIYVLSPEDNLLQVSIHTAKHSFFRAPGFRLHLDVLRVTSYFKVDWDVFIERTKKANTKTAVYFSLIFSRDLLGANVPDYILDKLRPNLLKIKLIEFCLRKVTLRKRFYFTRVEFVLFQLALYDSFIDVLQVAFPPWKTVKIKYGIRFAPLAYIVHLFDLIGVRKKYKK